MEKNLSKLELLPKEVILNGKYYYLGVWTNIKYRLCVGYRDMTNFPREVNTVLTFVVDPDNEEYLPHNNTDLVSLVNEVGYCKSLDRACDAIKEAFMNPDLLR